MADLGYTKLAFESQIFMKPIWRLDDITQASQTVHKALNEDVLLISYRETGQEDNLAMLKDAGFYQIETLITFTKCLSTKGGWPNDVRLSKIEDATAVKSLAEVAFKYDRYHADPSISNNLADELKGIWAYNSVSGRADVVFLYEVDGEIAGFNACQLKDNLAIIDLIAVHPDYQGRGIGKALVEAMACHYFDKAAFIQLGTQAANTASQAFYKSLGFVQKASQATWHWTAKEKKIIQS